ncbi:MAG: HAD family hydrolase [Leptospirillia bacterium]
MHAPLSTYRAAVFDLDGTLIDSTGPIVASTQAAISELGWEPVPPEVIVSHIGYKLEAIFPERTLEERRLLVDTIGKHYDGICAEQTVLYPGMGELLTRLAAAEVPLGVVTSKRRRHTERILNALGVRQHFRVVLGSDDVARMKPDPEGLLTAVQTLDVAAGEALYVGDTRIDIQTARAAGVAVAGVAWGTDGPEALQAAGVDHAVHSPDGIDPLFPPPA